MDELIPAPDPNSEDLNDETAARQEPTAEQVAMVHQTNEAIRLALSQVVTIPNPILPKSLLMDVANTSRIINAHNAMVATSIKPIIEAHRAWQRQAAAIASEYVRSHALAQSNLNLLASQLTGNLDFSALISASRAMQDFATQQATWLTSLGPAMAAMRAGFYPPNLRDIENLKFEEVEQVVMVDGIPLYMVPRASIAAALVKAATTGARREILGRRWSSIAADCREAVVSCGTEASAPYRRFALAAIDALKAGHTEAAQALVGSLVDSILNAYFGSDRYKYTPDRNGKRTNDAYDEFSVRQFIAFAPIWQTYQQYFVTNGDRVPMTFSRNATAHTVHPRQFNRRNTIQGLMLVASLIVRIDEESRGE